MRLSSTEVCDLLAVCRARKFGIITLDMKKRNVHVKKGMILSKQSAFRLIFRVKHAKPLAANKISQQILQMWIWSS